MKTSDQKLNNKKMKKKKKVSKMKKIIIKNAMAIVAIAIAMGSYALMSFGAGTKSDEMITFEYKPPTNDPYSQANVEDLSNWKPADDPCPTNGDLAACTIEVHEDHTVGGAGQELDPAVVLNTSSNSANVFKVDSPGPSSNYMNPINRSTL